MLYYIIRNSFGTLIVEAVEQSIRLEILEEESNGLWG